MAPVSGDWLSVKVRLWPDSTLPGALSDVQALLPTDQVAAGAVQGFFGGRVDLIFQRFLEIWSSIPSLFVLIIISSVLVPGFWTLLGVLLLFHWVYLVGVVRAEFLRGRNFEYITAARALGRCGAGDGQCRDQSPGDDDRLSQRFLGDGDRDGAVGAAGDRAAAAQGTRGQARSGGGGALGHSPQAWVSASLSAAR